MNNNLFLILEGGAGANQIAINISCISSIVSTGNHNERTAIYFTEGSMSRKVTTSQKFEEVMKLIKGE